MRPLLNGLIALCILSLTPAFALAEPYRGGGQGGEGGGVISVQAEGTISATPDILVLPIHIRRTAPTLAEASAEADALAAKVTDIVKAAGIPAEDIDNSRMASWADYSWRNGERRHRGEAVRRELRITIRDLDGFGPLVGRLGGLSIHLGSPQLGYSNIDELRADALRDALRRGREKAALIAKEIGATLGPVVAVEESYDGPHYRPWMMAESAASDSGSTSLGFSFGDRDITARVGMQFLILPR